MRSHITSFIVAAAFVSSAATAQTFPRRADLRGGGNGNSGKCTVEVVVDGSAQVEIRGDSGILRNLQGQPPQWRRFVCTSPLPANPVDFRFSGVDGRGRQELVRDPRQGGAAVIEINDPDNGSEGYTFDITWGGNDRGPLSNQYPPSRPGQGQYGGGDRRFTADQAVQLCQTSVRQQAADRYRTNDIRFRQTNIDDQPGRNDWVVGTLEARRPGRADQIAKFSCSVDFASGRVRSADIQPFYAEGRGPDMTGPNGRGPGFGGQARMKAAAIQNCQRAVQDKTARDGYGRIDFGNVSFDDRPGRNDWVLGDFRAVGRYGPESMRFSCSVDLRDGDVKSLDITTRQ
ncbi:MAG: hypothetical protein ABJC09_05680 [Terriglobia bacterium]